TRFSRDWSSDVCSSDLKLYPAGGESRHAWTGRFRNIALRNPDQLSLVCDHMGEDNLCLCGARVAPMDIKLFSGAEQAEMGAEGAEKSDGAFSDENGFLNGGIARSEKSIEFDLGSYKPADAENKKAR